MAMGWQDDEPKRITPDPQREYHLAQLRHLYYQMVNGQVTNTKMVAEGLLGPAIACFERESRTAQ